MELSLHRVGVSLCQHSNDIVCSVVVLCGATKIGTSCLWVMENTFLFGWLPSLIINLVNLLLVVDGASRSLLVMRPASQTVYFAAPTSLSRILGTDVEGFS